MFLEYPGKVVASRLHIPLQRLILSKIDPAPTNLANRLSLFYFNHHVRDPLADSLPSVHVCVVIVARLDFQPLLQHMVLSMDSRAVCLQIGVLVDQSRVLAGELVVQLEGHEGGGGLIAPFLLFGIELVDDL